MLKIGEILTDNDCEYKVIELLGRGANTAAFLAERSCGGLTSRCILKEFAPQNTDADERAKSHFIESARLQEQIRQRSFLTNQTPPVSRIFEQNGTAYIDVTCFGGTTLDRLDLTLPQYIAICATVARTAGYYHDSGWLCLDLKPENIFILQNSPEDTLTQLVEFIDFDSVRRIGSSPSVVSYTRGWAAPEQQDPYSAARVGKAADIYTLGELVFYLLFGRHSTEQEHRGFSKYPFDECPRGRRKFTDRPDIRAFFTELFRGTLRSSAANRFADVGEVVRLLEKLSVELDRPDYVIPRFPTVPTNFVGRDSELKAIADNLNGDRVLYITGVGGIGKSALVRSYIERRKIDYDVIAYLEFESDLVRTFSDDMQLQLSTVSRFDGESDGEYFTRKLTHFKRICGEKRVLFVIDNFSGRVTKDLSRILDCGYDTIIVTRNQPPKNSFPHMEIGALGNEQLLRLIALNLDRPLTKQERESFADIITLTHGHTLVSELIARQIAAGRLDVRTALELIRRHGFSRFSTEKIGNFKDGEEIYDTLSAIISALFDSGRMTARERLAMKVLSLLDVRGLETGLLQRFFPEIGTDVLTELARQGWIYSDGRVRLHPVIAETAHGWKWSADEVMVMECHGKMVDIYEGMSNAEHIGEILREAELYKNMHPRHIVNALYFDMLGSYYDTLTDGNYVPYTDEEAELLQKLTDAMENAIAEMERSTDPARGDYLIKFYLSMASIYIRSAPKFFSKAAELLDLVSGLLSDKPKECENQCYYCMVKAWYYTLAEPNLKRTLKLTKRAEQIAFKIFPTGLEIIDIIHIPTANCLYFHDDLNGAADKLRQAVLICEKYPDILPYIDKRAELLVCLLDVYYEMGDPAVCQKLVSEIDRINEQYREQGICHEIPREIRENI